VLARLVDNVTLGVEGSTRRVNVSHEVFACNCIPLMHALLSDSALLARVFRILDQPNPLNARLAGYFSSLLALLPRHDAARVLLMASGYAVDDVPTRDGGAKQLDSRKRTGGPEDATEPAAKHAMPQGLLPRFVRHLDSYSVASAMTTLIHEAAGLQPGKSEVRDACRELWLGGRGCAQLVLAHMTQSQDQDVHNNAADVLSELLNAAAKAPEPSEWAPHLINDAVEIVVANPAPSLANALVRVLLQVVIAHTGSPAAGHAAIVSRELQSIVAQLPALCTVLKADSAAELIETQWGGRIRPLGMTRLLLAELVGSLIVSGLVSGVIADCAEDPLGLLVGLFFEYEWNNALHSVVERVVRAILTGERPRDEVTAAAAAAAAMMAGGAEATLVQTDDEAIRVRRLELRAWTKQALAPLCDVLLERCRLCERVMEAYAASTAAKQATRRRSEGDVAVDRASTLRKAYMGYVHSMSNALRQSGLCDGVAGWPEFVAGELAAANAHIATPLGGGKPSLDRPSAAGGGLMAGSPGGHHLGSLGMFSMQGRGAGWGNEADDDDDDDEDEYDDDQDEESIMRKYGLHKDPHTGELVFLAAPTAASVPKPVDPPLIGDDDDDDDNDDDDNEEEENEAASPDQRGDGGGGNHAQREEDDEEEEADWIADFSSKPAAVPAANESTTAAAAATSRPVPNKGGWADGAFASPEQKVAHLAWDLSPEKFPDAADAADSPDSESSREGRAVTGPGWEHLDLQNDEHKPPAAVASAMPPPDFISSSVGSSSGWVADFDDE